MEDLRGFYGKVYDVLTSIAGAKKEDGTKNHFVNVHTDGTCDEWIFQGKFAFGGKYRRRTNTIDCYQEDSYPELDELISNINEILAHYEKVWRSPLKEKENFFYKTVSETPISIKIVSVYWFEYLETLKEEGEKNLKCLTDEEDVAAAKFGREKSAELEPIIYKWVEDEMPVKNNIPSLIKKDVLKWVVNGML